MDEVSNTSKKKPRSEKQLHPQDRATLTPATAKKLDAWLEQIDSKYNGLVSVSRSDLTNYFLDKQPDLLNRDQLEKIKAAHFDEVRFAQWALKQIKDSKQKGESLSLKDLVSMSRLVDAEAPKRVRSPKSTESTEAPATGDENSDEKSNDEAP
jgi:hypothetical protein